jgi:hypothetical protein
MILKTPEKAVENTTLYFKEKANNDHSPIILKDVQTLKWAQRIKELKSQGTDQEAQEKNKKIIDDNIYFWADLVRAMVADEFAQEKETDYIAYADLNVPPLSGKELFDEDTLTKLKEYGLVMAVNHSGQMEADFKFENGFFILDPNNESMLQAQRLGLIELNIKRLEYLSNRAKLYDMFRLEKGGYSKNNEQGAIFQKDIFPEAVWMSYPPVFYYYNYLQMKGDFSKLEDDRKVYKSPSLLKGAFVKNNYIREKSSRFMKNVPENKIESLGLPIDSTKTRKEKYHSKNLTDLFDLNAACLKEIFKFWRENKKVEEKGEDGLYFKYYVPSTRLIPAKEVNKPTSSFYAKKYLKNN